MVTTTNRSDIFQQSFNFIDNCRVDSLIIWYLFVNDFPFRKQIAFLLI